MSPKDGVEIKMIDHNMKSDMENGNVAHGSAKFDKDTHQFTVAVGRWRTNEWVKREVFFCSYQFISIFAAPNQEFIAKMRFKNTAGENDSQKILVRRVQFLHQKAGFSLNGIFINFKFAP